VLMTGMQHGTEFCGPAALDQVLSCIDPAAMRGTLVGMPFVNPFHARLTYAEHSRLHADPATNLNRQWRDRTDRDNPFTRLAACLWDHAVCHADFLVDMHCCRDNDPRFSACLEGHAPSEALAEAAGFEAVDRQTAESYDSRQLMLAVAAELDRPAILVESRPGGYQTPEAVEACAKALFRVLVHAGVLESFTLNPLVDEQPAVFRRPDKAHALRATQAGYLAIRRFPGCRVKTGEPVAQVRSMDTFEVVESLEAPVDGGVGSVAEFDNWPFVEPGDCAGGVKPLAAPRLD